MRILIGILLVLFLWLQFRLWVGQGSLAEVHNLKQEITRQQTELEALRQAEAVSPPLVQCDLRAGLPFADGSFELVFSVRFLHHVREQAWREQLLAEMVRASSRYVLLSYYEAASLEPGTRVALEALGHTLVERTGVSGDVQMILVVDGMLTAWSDPRRGGRAIGY